MSSRESRTVSVEVIREEMLDAGVPDAVVDEAIELALIRDENRTEHRRALDADHA